MTTKKSPRPCRCADKPSLELVEAPKPKPKPPKVTRTPGPDGGIDAHVTGDLACLGVGEPGAQELLLGGIVKLCKGAPDSVPNSALAMLSELAPKDATESLLCTQAIACHTIAMALAAQVLDQAARPNRLGMAQTALSAAKTSAHLLTTLERKRRGPVTTQRVVVERVDIAAGAQAVVGMVGGSNPGGVQ